MKRRTYRRDSRLEPFTFSSCFKSYHAGARYVILRAGARLDRAGRYEQGLRDVNNRTLFSPHPGACQNKEVAADGKVLSRKVGKTDKDTEGTGKGKKKKEKGPE
jgi:hypothetical protein